MMFFLGTHEPSWLSSPAFADASLFISRQRLARLRSLPRALAPWALDSGAFSQVSRYGAHEITPRQYVAEVRRYRDEIGQMTFASCQDWMCEQDVIDETGLSVIVHQTRTVRSYLTLRDIAPEIPWAPAIQGYTLAEYHRCIDMYDAAGVDLADPSIPVVGIGSVCKRQSTKRATFIIHSIAQRDGGRLAGRLHGYGFKKLGLPRTQHLLLSADSLSWSYRARRERAPLMPGCTHATCSNCALWALKWREQLLALLTKPRQPMLKGLW